MRKHDKDEDDGLNRINFHNIKMKRKNKEEAFATNSII